MVLKNEDTWYSLLGYYRYQIRYNLSEYSKGGGLDGKLYKIATRTATCMSVTSTGTVSSGTGTTIGSTTTSTTTTLLLAPATVLISPLIF